MIPGESKMRHDLTGDQQLVLEEIFKDWIANAQWPKEIRLVLRFRERGNDFFRRTIASMPGNLVASDQGMVSEKRHRLTMEGISYCKDGSPIVQAHLRLVQLAFQRFIKNPGDWARVTDTDLLKTLGPTDRKRAEAIGLAIKDELGGWASGGGGKDESGHWEIRAGLRIVCFADVKSLQDYRNAQRSASPVKELREDHIEFLRAVYRYWHEHKKWPLLREFVVGYIEKGNGWKLLHEIPDGPYWLGFDASDPSNPASTKEIRLRPKGIEATGIGQEELDLAARIIAAACKRFLKTDGERIVIKGEEIASDLGLTYSTIHHVGLLLEWSSSLGIYIEDQKSTWNVIPTIDILPYENVKTWAELDRVRREQEAIAVEAMNSRSHRFGQDALVQDQLGARAIAPTGANGPSAPEANPPPWDVFISHASEDKDDVVEPLAKALKDRGLTVWYDRWTLNIGDSLREKIDQGLKQSRFGLVVLSPSFFAKKWPQRELNGLVQREMGGQPNVILPIWHQVDQKTVAAYSPPLADKVAGNTKEGIEKLAERILAVIRPPATNP